MRLHDFDSLSEEEKVVVAFYAFCGGFIECKSSMISLVLRYICVGKSVDADDMAKSLYMRGFLEAETKYGAFSKYIVAVGYELPVVAELYRNHKDWIAIFESVCEGRGERSGLAFREWWLAKMNFTNSSADIYGCGIRATNLLMSVFADTDWQPLMQALPSKIFSNCLESALNKVLYDGGSFEWDYVATLVNYHYKCDECSDSSETATKDSFFLYRYMATGADDYKFFGTNRWGYLYFALALMRSGNYSDAVSAFHKSLDSFGTSCNERGVFNAFVFNYFYVVALLLDSPIKNEKRLQTLLKKHSVSEDELCQMSLVPLIKNKLDGDDFKQRGKHFVADYYSPMAVRLASSLCRQFNIGLPSNAKCGWWIVEAENDSANSLVAKLCKVEPWMYMLDNIENVKITVPSAREERLIYVLEPMEMRISPFIQKKNSNGEWENSIQRIWKGKSREIPECATDYDFRILKMLPEGQMSFKGGDGLLTFVDCDHIYLMPKWKKQLNPVVVQLEHPYLIVNKENDGPFRIYSNINVSDLDKQTNAFVRIVDDYHYNVIHLRERERMIYKTLLTTPSIPAEGETRLKSALQRIDSVTKIYSNLIHKDESFEDADSRLVVRIYPNNNQGATWRLEILTVPFVGSVYTTTPAQGQSLNILNDGKTLRLLRRDFEAEKRNLFAFEEFCKSISVIYDDEDAADLFSVLLNLENVLDIITWARENPKMAVVELMEGCRFNMSEKLTSDNLQIESLQSAHGWLDFKASIVSSDSRMQLCELMDKMQHGVGKYIRVDGDNYVEVSQSLRDLIFRLKLYNDKLTSKLSLPELALSSLDDDLDAALSKANDSVRSICRRIKESKDIMFDVPSSLNGELKQYQIDGYQWMMRTLSWSGGVCLADDMGLGKTVQTIAVMLDKSSDGPSLVVAPTSVVLNWNREIEKFAPSLHTIVLNQAVNKSKAIEDAVAGDVVVVSYGMLLTQIVSLAEKEWNVIVLDEAHAIKNSNTKAFKSVIKLNGANRIVLTGTPIQNHFSEIWSLFHFSNPGLLGSQKLFAEKVKFNRERDEDWADEMAKEINEIVRPFILRRTKKEVLDELPGIEDVVYDVELSKEEYAIYNSTRLAVKKEFEENDAYSLDRKISAVGQHKVAVFAMLTKLRELTCSPSLLVQGWTKRSSKETAFIDLLQEIDLEENRVLVFSQFTGFLSRIQNILQEEGVDCLYLDGSTPMKERARLIDEFQAGKTPVFLISLKAGGVGLNLTAANYVVHLDPWWNPAIEQQATDRAYRIGQDQKVTVFHFIARGTIEEKMLELQRRKQTVSDMVLSETNSSSFMTKDDIIDILNGQF